MERKKEKEGEQEKLHNQNVPKFMSERIRRECLFCTVSKTGDSPLHNMKETDSRREREGE